ncbi:MAG: hypothetical protein A2Y03_10530 [Omnitrophica WOR_2 bacterium GWF2_38_59]|nr:MAG: hypothetical protein A2Y03_10530 [Omnitrophica WOR_2 bacterium GWF2_38_59]OGX50861.1 MAG: hypothetical protein A2243_06155 [Omnitrophica WOR_2 bacterium RIFOXYA2_FULL_38_17]OGX53936.1 MAG: hypothetical protein A2267_07410 [Omnitrophica WOR_2 bacterium RIFOXYA12_FULL_38_10]OGX59886.1 MAG: hypothetical protein A2306_00870 [Omnitrophica WOR_2 bacterium RIFOXYB2_FULL_38_16]HBG60497.1 hypothetical protein [Candidatus Omnitrophota bacterium]
MRVRVLDERADVYQQSNKESNVVGELRLGDEFTLGKVVKYKGAEWVASTMSDGTRGYVLGDIKVYCIREVILCQKNANVYQNPDSNSKVKMTLKKGEKLTLLNLINQNGSDWVEVRTEEGEVGFISAETRVKNIASDELFKEKDYKAFMTGVLIIGGLIGIPLIYGVGGGISYFESLPWSFVSCIVFLIAFRRNGTISWGRAVPAIICAMFLAKTYNESSGRPSFAAGGFFGILLVFACGYAGIGVDRLLKKTKDQ